MRAIDCGADDFLSKPVTRLELISRINSLLRIKRLHEALEQKKRELAAAKADLAVFANRVKGEIESLLEKDDNRVEIHKRLSDILNEVAGSVSLEGTSGEPE